MTAIKHDFLNQNLPVVTCSDISARMLQLDYSINRKNGGESVWETPKITSFHRWVAAAWESCWPEKQLLHPVQTLALYKSAIDSSGKGEGLLSTTSTARSAKSAGSISCAYEIDQTSPQFSMSAESSAFIQWDKMVSERMIDMGWLTADHLLGELICFIESGRWQPDPHIRLVGLTETTPLQNKLFDALIKAGTVLEHVSVEIRNASIQNWTHESPTTQFKWLANQIKSDLSPHIDNPGSAPRIAVVVPKINDIRGGLESVLTEYLAPNYLIPSLSEKRIPWRFTHGQPLSEHELIQSGLDVLQLSLRNNDISLVTRVLLNKRFGNGPEYARRAMIDLQLRRSEGNNIPLKRLLNLALKDEAETSAPLFAKRLECLIETMSTNQGKQLPSRWLEIFNERIHCLGWPGDDQMSSEEYQVINAWNDCLRAFASMDRQLGSVNGEQAFAWVRELLCTREFQARVPYQQPVQIIQIDEINGLIFDKAYVLDVSNEVLPRTVDNNPLIPVDVQREYGVKGSSPELILTEAQITCRQISGLATEVNISCALHNDAGVEIIPSPLFDVWHAANGEQSASSLRELIVSRGIKTSIADDEVIPQVVSPTDEGIRDGVHIVSWTADSPFVSFLRSRLGIQPFPHPATGLTKLHQGDLVHAVLEHAWKVMKTQSSLLAMSKSGRGEQIKSSIQASIVDNGLLPVWRYGARLVQLELDRVFQVVSQWLQLEALRKDPFEVFKIECRSEGEIGGLPMRFRLDRVDKILLPDGEIKTVVIDYKTGDKVKTDGWMVEHLTSPQLPLYATIADLTSFDIDHVDGIAFAHVVDKKSSFHLRTSWTDDLINGASDGDSAKADNWKMQCDEWRAAIGELVDTFMNGSALVNKARFQKNPLYKDLHPFLRDDITTDSENC